MSSLCSRCQCHPFVRGWAPSCSRASRALAAPRVPLHLPRALSAPRVPLHLCAPASALAAPRAPQHTAWSEADISLVRLARSPCLACPCICVPLHLLHLPRGLACPHRASRAPASARDVLDVLTVAGGLTGPADPAPFPRRPRPASAVGPQAPHTSMPGKARVFALASLGKTLSGIVPILLWILLLDSIQDATARPNFDRLLECRGCSSYSPPTHFPTACLSGGMQCTVMLSFACSHSSK
jgi:hypothetical protein